MTQEGGVVYSFQMLLNNLDSPAKLIYGFIVILIIVYSSEIPSEYKLFIDSILGRVFGIAIIYGIVQSLGWVYGLLTSLAFLLIMNGANRTMNQNIDQLKDLKEQISKMVETRKKNGTYRVSEETRKKISESNRKKSNLSGTGLEKFF